MNDWIESVNTFLGGAGSSALGDALIGLAILIGGLLVVRVVGAFAKSSLEKLSFLKRTAPDGSERTFVPPIVSFIKGILTLFVLMAVLQHFGLTDVLEPLQALADKFLAALPNIIGAGVYCLCRLDPCQTRCRFRALGLGKSRRANSGTVGER